MNFPPFFPQIYALPEDLTEVKHKMVMTVYASLMLVDMK